MTIDATALGSGVVSHADEDLVAAYYGCDEGAFQTLYDRYYGRIVSYFRALGVCDIAEDLAEDTFLRLVNTKSRPSGRFQSARGSFKTWLFWLAQNVVYDHWRAVETRPKVVQPVRQSQDGDQQSNAIENYQDPRLDPEREVTWDELSSFMIQCLSELTEDEFKVFVMRALHEKGVEEVAKCSGRSTGWVSTIDKKARKKMKENLRAKGMYVWISEG